MSLQQVLVLDMLLQLVLPCQDEGTFCDRHIEEILSQKMMVQLFKQERWNCLISVAWGLTALTQNIGQGLHVATRGTLQTQYQLHVAHLASMDATCT